MQQPSQYGRPFPKQGSSFLKMVWFFIEPHKWKFWFYTANRVIINILYVLGPYIVSKVIEYTESGQVQIEGHNYVYWMLGVLFVSRVIAYLLGLMRVQEAMMRDLIKRELSIFAITHMLQLALTWHEQEGTGNKMQRVFTSRDALSALMKLFLNQGTMFIGQLGFMFIVVALNAPWFYSVLLIVYMLSYFLSATLTTGKLNYWNDLSNKYFEDVVGKMYEYASAVYTAKFFHLISFIKKKAWKVEMIQQKNMWGLYNSIFRRWFILDNMANAFSVGITALAFYQLIQGDISIGVTIMIMWYTGWVWDILDDSAEIQEQYFDSKSKFLRIVPVLQNQKEYLDYKPQKKFPNNWKTIKFHTVSFSYDKESVLKNINLTIPRGQRIALVGRSGSGKSTFVKLLMKQVLPSKGGILFDDIDMKYITQKQLLEQTSIVLQETELFNVSIEENVLLDSVHRKKLPKYLKMAYADTFVNQLPDKEKTVIGERGVKLSGGEKQRIGIARALAQESDILIFDEATSALDTESEKAIQKSMHEIFRGKTVFVIAHRLSTIKEVDRILVFDEGEIIEDGDFEALLKKDGVFAKLWKLQRLD